MKNIVLISLIYLFQHSNAFAQVSSNIFAQSSGTYTNITGGTVLFTGTFDEDISAAITIPAFKFNCTTFTQLFVSANGYISFGSAPSGSDYTPISGNNTSGIVAAFAADLDNAAAGTPEIRYQDIGASTEFVIQWRDVKRFSITGERISFQIRLNYTTNVVRIIYGGTITANAATTPTVQVGLRGLTNTDFINRSTTTNWASTTAGGTNGSSCTFSGTIKPASGLTFSYTPTNMSFVSCTVAQATTAGVEKCTTQQQILRLEVVTTGCTTPINFTQLIMNMTGSTIPGTNTNDVSLIHVYYTGSSNTFSTATAFNGVGTAVATGALTINGSQALTSGTNYFWIAYDMNNASATIGNVVDANCTSMTVGGTARVPTTTNPAGNRSIIACAGSPGGVSSGLSVWYKADNTGSITMGTGVATWNSSAGSAGTFPVTQATGSQQPGIISGATNSKLFNYNPRFDFVLASNTFLSNTATSPDLMTANGSYFVVSDNSTDDFTGFCYTADLFAYRHQFKPGFRAQTTDASQNGWTFDWATPTEYTNLSAYLTTTTGSGSTQATSKNSVALVAANSNDPTYTPSISSGLFIGRNGNGGEDTDANIAEIIMYNVTPSALNKNKIESYLALKFGLTRGGNTGTAATFNYLSSAGTTIWNKTTNSGFNRDIAGIGRDDASALFQKQSISVNNNEPVTIGLVSINSSNQTNANAFTNDQSFLIWGNNGLLNQVTSNPVCFANLPVGIYAHIERVWKSQNTNFTQNTTVGFETSMLVAFTPVSNLRLLVDNDGVDWTDATIITGAVINGSRVEFSGVTLNSTKPFFTLATITPLTPLPVTILDFKANLIERDVVLNWKTSSENNSDYFIIEKSQDGTNWEFVSQTPAAGFSNTLLTYSTLDENPFNGVSYYRLLQFDKNGTIAETKMDVINVDGFNFDNDFVYPNPTNQLLYVKINENELQDLQLYSILGQDVLNSVTIYQQSESIFILDLNQLSNGVYTIRNGSKVNHIVKQ